jgi:hypothetical protein
VHSQGLLPALGELDRTSFVRIPNEAKAVIVYLDANPPHKETGYCFLQAHESADMDKVESSDKAYRAAFGVTGMEDLPQEMWDKFLEYVPGKSLVALSLTSHASENRVRAELEKEQKRQEKTSQLVDRMQTLEEIPIENDEDPRITEFQVIVAEALDDSFVELRAEHIARVVRAALEGVPGSRFMFSAPVNRVMDSASSRENLTAFKGMTQLIENISAADQVKALNTGEFQTVLLPAHFPNIEEHVTANLRLGSIVAKIRDQKLKASGINFLIDIAPQNLAALHAPVVKNIISLVNSITESEPRRDYAKKVSRHFMAGIVWSYMCAPEEEEEKKILKALGKQLISLLDKNEIKRPSDIPWSDES